MSSFLTDAQQRLWRLIAHPEGVEAALRDERNAPPLAELVRSDERLRAEDRLDVYANAYFYRILEVLREDYPGLARAMGDDDFHDLVTSYLTVHPSRHFSLRWIGAALEGFLRRAPAAASFRRRWPWCADLARLEWALCDVFDAEDAVPARREELAGLPPERWEALPLRSGPAVRRLDLAWTVGPLRRAAREGGEPPPPRNQDTRVCVFRRQERVFHRVLAHDEARALDRVLAGASFGDVCWEAARDRDDDEAAARAASWLARWIEDELLLPFAP